MNKQISSLYELSQSVSPIKISKEKSKDLTHIGITESSEHLSLYLINEFVKNKNIKKITFFIQDKQKYIQNKSLINLTFNEDKIFFIESKQNEFFDNDKNISYLESITQFIHCTTESESKHSLKNYFDDVLFTDSILKIWKKTRHDGTFHIISNLCIFSNGLLNFNINNNLELIKNNEHNGSRIHVPKYELTSNMNYFLMGQFAQTKWLMEYLLSQYENAQIIRLGTVTPAITSHKLIQSYFIEQLINQINKYSNHEHSLHAHKLMDLSPINEIAQHFSQNIDNQQRLTHIANETPLSIIDLIYVLKNFNYKSKPLNTLYFSKLNLLSKKSNTEPNLFQATKHIFTNFDNTKFTPPKIIIENYFKNFL